MRENDARKTPPLPRVPTSVRQPTRLYPDRQRMGTTEEIDGEDRSLDLKIAMIMIGVPLMKIRGQTRLSLAFFVFLNNYTFLLLVRSRMPGDSESLLIPLNIYRNQYLYAINIYAVLNHLSPWRSVSYSNYSKGPPQILYAYVSTLELVGDL